MGHKTSGLKQLGPVKSAVPFLGNGHIISKWNTRKRLYGSALRSYDAAVARNQPTPEQRRRKVINCMPGSKGCPTRKVSLPKLKCLEGPCPE